MHPRITKLLRNGAYIPVINEIGVLLPFDLLKYTWNLASISKHGIACRIEKNAPMQVLQKQEYTRANRR